MNPILAEIYSTIIPSAPFIIAAYALLLVMLLVWCFIMFRKQSKLDAQLRVMEDALIDSQGEE